MNNFTFENPTRIIFGRGTISGVGLQTASMGKRVLLLTGSGSVRASGLYDTVLTMLQKASIHVVEQFDITANPQIDSVRHGVELYKKYNLDSILALGGGSVIDSAKAVAMGVVYDGDPWDFFTKKTRVDKPAPLGVVLTLAGTGSEMNANLVIGNPDTGEKLGMYHPGVYPLFAILDPQITYTVPADQTAYGSVDILSHIFEQYFHTVTDSSLQDGFAETIMREVIKCAPLAIKTPTDYNARANLMWSSTLALNGLVGAGVKGDWASHMIEHELSARYGIAHGAGLAVVFPAWMKYVYQKNLEKFATFAKNVWNINQDGMDDEKLAMAGIEATEHFFRDTLGIGVRLADYGIDDSALKEMAAASTKDGALGSFMALNSDDVENIFVAAYQ